MGFHGTIIERILHGKPMITWNNGENRCSITHVNDFSVGVIGLLGNRKAYNEIFNIVGDETPSWKEVLETLSAILNVPLKTFDIPVDYYAGEIMSKDDLLGGRSISSKCSNKKIEYIVDDFKQTV
jgi:nucleoside-diphosphate-sugar epimerase